MDASSPREDGFALVVQPDGGRWVWALMDLEAQVTASGDAQDRDSAWRCGRVAAATIGALQRAGRRRF